MKLEDISVSCECEVIVENDKTKFFFGEVSYEVPFSFPINVNKRLIFNKISNYFISQHIEKSKVLLTDVRFQLYYIELYENDFKKAMEDFKKIICLDCNADLKKDVLVKAFFNILDISVKSFIKARSYIDDVKKVRTEGVKEVGIKGFYKIKSRDFIYMADYLDRNLTDNNLIENDNYRFAFRDYAAESKKWYSEVKFSSFQNKVYIGTRENFNELLKEQIDNAREANEDIYADYIEAILYFLKFYYKWF